jgi:hypothetical protein
MRRLPDPELIALARKGSLHTPTSLRIDRRGGRSLLAITRITKGSIVAQSPNGKRIAYAEVYESGRARLFTAPHCLPDQT